MGVDYGFSTFCFGYPQIGSVYGIDWFQGDDHAGHRDTLNLVDDLYQHVIKHFGVSNIQFIKSDFAEALRIPDAQQVITVLFLGIFPIEDCNDCSGMLTDPLMCPPLNS